MQFSDWHENFNNLYVCKVFPESWECYNIESRWQGKTAGGVCPPRLSHDGVDPTPEYLQLDSDDKWFNNPQFHLTVRRETKL